MLQTFLLKFCCKQNLYSFSCHIFLKNIFRRISTCSSHRCFFDCHLNGFNFRAIFVTPQIALLSGFFLAPFPQPAVFVFGYSFFFGCSGGSPLFVYLISHDYHKCFQVFTPLIPVPIPQKCLSGAASPALLLLLSLCIFIYYRLSATRNFNSFSSPFRDPREPCKYLWILWRQIDPSGDRSGFRWGNAVPISHSHLPPLTGKII